MTRASDPCYFVIFGATGNLATTHLLPALYELDVGGYLSEDLRFIAFARRRLSDEEWRQQLEGFLKKYAQNLYSSASCERFVQRFKYLYGDLNDSAAYEKIIAAMKGSHASACENIVFYLAIKPADFATVVENLDRAGINRRRSRNRIVVEKPFGEDVESAHALNELLHRHFDEGQIYRIDHFLGKETVRNLFVLRFANMLIESVWNRNYIDHVQITVAEKGGIENRADYYDRAGALRDMLQNHLMQLLTIVAMEPPAQLDADSLRDEKVKVLRSIRPIPEASVQEYVVEAQYGDGKVGDKTLRAYRGEANVPSTSITETFVAAKFYIDNWRWRDVPFYLRTGKRLARQTTLIGIRFRQPPQFLFQDTSAQVREPNWILLSLQPEEAVQIELYAKQPGLDIQTRTIHLDAMYREMHAAPIEAYQTLLLDVIQGDRSLFLRFDEVEWAWRVVDPILRFSAKQRRSVLTYPAGSWGPPEASRIFDRADHAWRNEV